MPKRSRREEQGCWILVLAAAGIVFLVWLWDTHPVYFVLGVLLAIVSLGLYLWLEHRVRQEARKTLVGRLAVPDQMAQLSPLEFESACAALFSSLGYRTSLTSTSGDEGVDIFLYRQLRRDIAQCKHYLSSTVGSPEVRDLLGAKQDFGAENAYLLTSGDFSRPALELARRNHGLHLWDRAKLVKKARTVLLQQMLSSRNE